MRRNYYLLTVWGLWMFAGCVLAIPPFAHSIGDVYQKQKIQEYNLHDDRAELAPELSLLDESEQAVALSTLLFDLGSSTAAMQEFSYALDNFFFSGCDLDESPLAQAHFLEILQYAEIFRVNEGLLEGIESGMDSSEETEESPLETMVYERLMPATIDPQIEHLIEEDILNQKYDFPVFVNNEVMTYIHYMTTGKKGQVIELGLNRLGRYSSLFTRIFREEGLPLDLVYFGLVESNFSPQAYSRARARGIWQFIEWTGRRYGLRVDWWVDERSDPEKATRAACQYIKELYEMFGDWYLVLAAYNSGEGRISRILNRHPNHDYWEMCRNRYLPNETRGYVPAILAAIIIAKNPERFGVTPTPAEPISYISVEIPSPTDLQVVAETIGVPLATLQELNPALRRSVTPPTDKTFFIHVPVDTTPESMAMLYDLPTKERLKWVQHRVRKGDTLARVARQYHVSTAAIQECNSLPGRHPRLRAGQDLLIPLSSFRGDSRPSERNGLTSSRISAGSYRVRKGDNLWDIAKRADVPLSSLMRWNNLHSNKSLKTGMILRLKSTPRNEPDHSSPSLAGTPRKQTPTPRVSTYTVRPGDTLWEIGAKFNVSPASLRAANGLKNGGTLRAGQKLAIPGANGQPASASGAVDHVHRVKKGETLFSIAQQYRVDVPRLKKANAITGDNIHPGDQLVIPN